MSGFIGSRQVVSQFHVIWREFGPRCAVRCASAILHRRPTTFLDVAFNTGARTHHRRPLSRALRPEPASAVTERSPDLSPARESPHNHAA
jgi:hypothetical protein